MIYNVMKQLTSTRLVIGSLGVGAILSLFASSSPDGLERVAKDVGFLEHAAFPFRALMPDYAFLGISHELLATSLAGIAGTIMVFFVLYLLGKDMYRSDGQ